jgi:formylglycine-generating enzyme required for sulfatase activity
MAWLAKSGRVPGARLCTDHEWERAGRGADEREFPHGNKLDPSEANFDETYGQDGKKVGPDSVGSYPMSESPFMLFDMSGNAHEWVRSSVSKDSFVIRSGCSYNPKFTSNLTNRGLIDTAYKDQYIGMRICASRN